MIILAYSIAAHGHLNPLMSICARLAKRGHTVIFCTAECMRKSLEEKVTSDGYHFTGLDNNVTEEDIAGMLKNPRFSYLGNIDQPLLRTLIDERNNQSKPRVILADLMSVAAHRISREKGIPLVMNAPGSLMLVTQFLSLGNPFKRMLAKVTTPSLSEAIDVFGKEIGPTSQRSIVLINSAWGLDKPIPIEPNFFLTGPLSPRSIEAKRLKKEDHQELITFLEKGSETEKPVVYVTTGSVLLLSKEQVLKIFNAFDGCDCYVVWSLKEETHKFLPDPVPPHFYVKSWIPQIELLAEESVKVVLTHCGWGGTLECMQNAKPVICFPSFADQPHNGDTLVERGCGLKVDPKSFTSHGLQKAMKDIMQDYGEYSENCMFLKKALMATKGAKLACETIEDVVEYGIERLL